MKFNALLWPVGIAFGRRCPDCERGTVRVPPYGLLRLPLSVSADYVSFRYCSQCDQRRVYIHSKSETHAR